MNHTLKNDPSGGRTVSLNSERTLGANPILSHPHPSFVQAGTTDPRLDVNPILPIPPPHLAGFLA